MGRLPDFLGIGAEKCATTWLHGCLSRHPDIFLPLIKETRYFEREFQRGLDWYRQFFRNARDYQLIGEICPVYLHAPSAAERIYNAIPNVKLIISLRNPVARAYSEYWMDARGYLARGDAVPAFEEIIVKEPKYLAKGLYAKSISKYFKLFGRDNVYVLFCENLFNQPLSEINLLFAWLGIPEMDEEAILGVQLNESKTYVFPRLFGALQKAVQVIDNSPLSPAIWWTKRIGMRNAVLKALEKPRKYPAMKTETKILLSQYFREANRDLRRLLSLDELPW